MQVLAILDAVDAITPFGVLEEEDRSVLRHSTIVGALDDPRCCCPILAFHGPWYYRHLISRTLVRGFHLYRKSFGVIARIVAVAGRDSLSC